MVITWNPLDKGDNVTLSNENLTATLGGLHAVRATEGKSTGKWYWEILVEPNNTSHVVIGVDNGSEVVNHHGSTSGNNAIRMYASTGEKTGTTRTAYGQTYGANDVIGVALNIDDGIIGFYKNGVYQGDAFNDLAGMSKPIFPRVGSWSSYGVKIVSTNFGHKPFKYSIPKGYYSYDGSQYGNDKILILSNDNKVKSLKTIGGINHLTELPSISEKNFIDYGMNSHIQFNRIFTNKNYILQDGVSENENGYWTTKLDRKPLSIKFE